MRIYQILFAENIQNYPPIVRGLIPGYLQFPYLPTSTKPILFSFSMGVVLRGENNEDLNQPISIEVVAPSGGIIGRGDATSSVTNPGNIQNVEGYVSGFVNLDLRNFPFSEVGQYAFRVTVGDLTQQEILDVTVVEQNG